MQQPLVLDGSSLAIPDLAALFAGDEWVELQISIAPVARQRVSASRAVVETALQSGRPVYGLTTGFGRLKNQIIPEPELAELQQNLILSHCCGIGPPMPIAEVRAAQILRLNGLLRGHSGVTIELLHRLVEVANDQFMPLVPQKG